MSTEQNLSVVHAFLDGVWNQHDLSVIDHVATPNHINHGPMTKNFPQGAEGLKVFCSGFLVAFPDIHVTYSNAASSGDQVSALLTFTGTHKGHLASIPPSGRGVHVQVKGTWRIANGRIAETWSDWDPNDLMRQIGAL